MPRTSAKPDYHPEHMSVGEIIRHALAGGSSVRFASELAHSDRDWDPEIDGGSILSFCSENLARNPAEIVGDRLFIDGLLSRLKPIQALVIRLVFLEGMNQSEAALALGISKNYASHIVKNGLAKMQQLAKLDQLREAV